MQLAVMDAFHTDLSGPVGRSTGGARLSAGGPRRVLAEGVGAHAGDKDEAAAAVLKIIREAETATGRKLKRLHSDGGGEYREKIFLEVLAKKGVEVTSTVAHTSQHNGKAERKNRTILNHARTLLEGAGECGLPRAGGARPPSPSRTS